MLEAHNQLMGVLNITPDSFSDGGQATSINSFTNKFEDLLCSVQIIDIGAESTAPFNQKISSQNELERFKNVFIPYMQNHDDPRITISIDTYKVNVFKVIGEEVKKYWPNSKLIFNDVSGKLDQELFSLWDEAKFDFDYVFSHNLAPDRESTQHHMNYKLNTNNWDFLEECINYFQTGLDKIKGVPSQVIIDPLFGFSKTRAQNHFLLNNIKNFLLQFHHDIPCLIGISRKSFLRVPADLDMTVEQNKIEVDFIQSNLLFNMIQEKLNRHIIYRVHDPVSFVAARKSFSILESAKEESLK